MDDEHSCFGCQKEFSTLKRLRAHEASCRAKKQLHDDILRSERNLQNARKLRKVRDPSPVAYAEDDVAISNDTHTYMDDIAASGPSNTVEHADTISPSPVPIHSRDNSEPASNPDRVDPPAAAQGRSRRHVRLPARYADYLPAVAHGLRHAPPPLDDSLGHSQQSSLSLAEEPVSSTEYATDPDHLGLFRVYPKRPTFTPPAEHKIGAYVDAPTLEKTDDNPQPDASEPGSSASHQGPPGGGIGPDDIFSAFSSPTAGLFMCWQYSGSTSKSIAEMKRLQYFFRDVQFDLKDFAAFDHDRERKRIEKFLQDGPSNPFRAEHGWHCSSVSIALPDEPKRRSEPSGEQSKPKQHSLPVNGVYHRDLTDVIVSALEDDTFMSFHTTPFEQYWKPSEAEDPIKLFGEAYTSPAYLDLYHEVNSLPREAGDDMERIVVPLMLWSDATQLANFGDASLWPIYLSFGNQSKYTRGQPTAAACHHVAYIPKLPDNFQDIYESCFGYPSSDDVYTLCKRELMQAIWELLLDDKFIDAYKKGRVVHCHDGIKRRAFFRFLIYAADYPEKILLACIKFLGRCPCPRCLVLKADIIQMGLESDMVTRETNIRRSGQELTMKVRKARKLIFRARATVNGTRVQNILQSESLVPIHNAFSKRISDDAFNFFCLLVIDLLHEFELGVWKAIFTHLMRILVAVGGSSVQQLNYRYRNVPTFGRGTIRRFHNNASSMKRLAARDFEDLLQCAIPVFEGLVPGAHNDIILDMLFDLATWHAYAKLRLHTERTLNFFEGATAFLGKSVRKFQRTTCAYYRTTELPQECAARGRRVAAIAAKKGQAPRHSAFTAKQKTLNLSTYKFHALGDYPATIRRYGTTDNYSTQIGELEHRRVKRRYPRSGKKKDSMTRSIANQEAIERFIRKVSEAYEKLTNPGPAQLHTSPYDHYSIAKSARKSSSVISWLGKLRGDPAFENFLPRLQDHLLARVRGLTYDGDEHDFTHADRSCINIKDDQLYFHKMLRVNYTTYDLRREQDTINPVTRADIMVLSHDEERSHPYWYARVIHVFHTMVQHRQDINSQFSPPRRMDVLFIRWFRQDVNYPSGWSAKRPPRLEFYNQESPDAFGFIDPDSVVRGIHIIPGFAFGQSDELLGPSQARRRQDGESPDTDWKYYYVNMFTDRDIFMRFRGGGVGHKATRDWDEQLAHDPGSAVEDEESDEESGEEMEEQEDSDSESDAEWETVMEVDKDGGDDGDDPGSESDREDEADDAVIAEEGEQLDTYAQEGYGAL